MICCCILAENSSGLFLSQITGLVRWSLVLKAPLPLFHFLKMYSFLIQCILITVSHLSISSSSPTFTIPLPQVHSFSFSPSEKYRPPRNINQTQITSYNKTTHIPSHIKAGEGNPIGGKGPPNRQKSQRQFLIPLLGISQKTKLHNHNICRGLRSDPSRLYDCCFCLCEPL